MTPFEAMYGHPPPTLLSYVPGTISNATADQVLRSRDQIIQLLKSNLNEAQNRMKQFADKKRIERTFEVDDWVYQKLQPYRQKGIAMKHNLKLAPRYYGPFQIERRVGSVAYRLKLPDSSRIHPTFYVSCLKRKLGPQVQVFPSLPPTDHMGEVKPMPKQVLERQMKR